MTGKYLCRRENSSSAFFSRNKIIFIDEVTSVSSWNTRHG